MKNIYLFLTSGCVCWLLFSCGEDSPPLTANFLMNGDDIADVTQFVGEPSSSDEGIQLTVAAAELVSLRSAATPSAAVEKHAWDLDGDGVPDFYGADTLVSFTEPGAYRVSYCVNDTACVTKYLLVTAATTTTSELAADTTAVLPLETDGDDTAYNYSDDDSDNDNDDIASAVDKPVVFSEPTPPPVADSDGDGVTDNRDECPNEYARTANGCPNLTLIPPTEPTPTPDLVEKSVDRDGDGVNDNTDKCPDQFARTTDGCPPAVVDSDADGLADDLDKCPNQYAKTKDGCPEPKKAKMQGKIARSGSQAIATIDGCGEQVGGVHTIYLKSKGPIELINGVVYSDQCGELKITLRNTTSGTAQSTTAVLIDGKNQVDLFDLFPLQSDQSYQLQLETRQGSAQFCSDATNPRLFNVQSCSPARNSGTQLEVDYTNQMVLVDLKYRY